MRILTLAVFLLTQFAFGYSVKADARAVTGIYRNPGKGTPFALPMVGKQLLATRQVPNAESVFIYRRATQFLPFVNPTAPNTKTHRREYAQVSNFQPFLRTGPIGL